MEPVKVDYEVLGPTRALVFTSDDPDIAIAWADKHSAPRYTLTVEKVEHRREQIHVAERLLDAAS